MLLPAQLETPRAVLIEVEVIAMVIAIGAWGGVVSFLLKSEGLKASSFHCRLMRCLNQIIISCFTSFILSAVAVEKGLSFNMILLFAGVGGVFSIPIIKILGARVKRIVSGKE
ncbi:phage holin family protein [Kluyvera ascorbata]|uniref:phage holin family protein n=1 Tax=Kluyvera ascorbata TaxID=51288 RepID=UPI0028DFA95E|nr:phage holin family protein [Kluyvera ascorbata]MDT8698988.1 phage holin family protein [Kluyvera ascorbata]HDG1670495.1 phage holin family protein [Kluyvera ascorbata]